MKAAVLLVLAACGSYSTYKSTRIAPTDRTQWLFAAQASGTIFPDNGGGAPLPEAAIGVRRGLSDRVEIQATGTLLPIAALETGSLEVAGKIRLAESGRFSLAVGAAASYRVAESGGAIIEGATASVPLIAGIDLGRHQLVVSVTGGYERWYAAGTSAPVSVPFIGESLGFLWQIDRRFALLPEIGWAYTSMRNPMTDDSRLFHVGVAVLVTPY